MKLSNQEMKDMYKTLYSIRAFETRAQKLFAEGKIPGFVHLYLGEEAVATGVCSLLRDTDFLTSTHRGHGHMVAKGGDYGKMMAELFGKKDGYCNGKGGSMHIADRSKGMLGANGIVGAGQNIAVGAGLTCQYNNTDNICACFFGDASTNQSTFHEALNLASIWKLPVVFICENNFYGISMSQERHQAIKDIADRAVAYNIPGIVVDGNDVLAVREVAQEAIERARKGQGPTLIECKTYRHRGHFEGDPGLYKPKEEQEAWFEKDPVTRYEKHLTENGIMSQKEIDEMRAEVEAEVEKAVVFAENSPYPDPESCVEDVYSDIKEEARVR